MEDQVRPGQLRLDQPQEEHEGDDIRNVDPHQALAEKAPKPQTLDRANAQAAGEENEGAQQVEAHKAPQLLEVEAQRREVVHAAMVQDQENDGERPQDIEGLQAPLYGGR